MTATAFNLKLFAFPKLGCLKAADCLLRLRHIHLRRLYIIRQWYLHRLQFACLFNRLVSPCYLTTVNSPQD